MIKMEEFSKNGRKLRPRKNFGGEESRPAASSRPGRPGRTYGAGKPAGDRRQSAYGKPGYGRAEKPGYGEQRNRNTENPRRPDSADPKDPDRTDRDSASRDSADRIDLQDSASRQEDSTEEAIPHVSAANLTRASTA